MPNRDSQDSSHSTFSDKQARGLNKMKAINVLHSETLDRVDAAQAHYESNSQVYQELCDLKKEYLSNFFFTISMMDNLPAAPSVDCTSIIELAEFYNWKIAIFRQVRERIAEIAGHVP